MAWHEIVAWVLASPTIISLLFLAAIIFIWKFPARPQLDTDTDWED